MARLHLHVARQRKEFHYHVAHWLINSYDLIVFETLNIRGLARTRLAKSILDVAWGAWKGNHASSSGKTRQADTWS
ncbi:MAG: hypothetical protein ACYTXC_28345 [Nostoc sp.]